MKLTILSAILAVLANQSAAAPTASSNSFRAQLTFEGADPEAFFTLSVPTDGSTFTIRTFDLFPRVPTMFCLYASRRLTGSMIQYIVTSTL